MAIFLNMHKEDPASEYVAQESRRRLMWCIFTADRFSAGGIPEYILLPTTTLSIQLPCQDLYFDTQRPVPCPGIYDVELSSSDLSLTAIAIRLFDVRSRILQYTKRLLTTSASPDQSLEKFKAFEKELRAIAVSIPAHLQFCDHVCYLRASSPERTTFIVFHIYIHHCHCELYRLLNPGYREALPAPVIGMTSPELVSYAQAKCLEHAVSIGDIIRMIHEMIKDALFVTDPSVFVLLYQASCAILYACHRDSPAFSMSPQLACGYLETFVLVLSKLLSYFPRFKVYVNDIKNMLRSIRHPGVPMPRQVAAAEVDFRERLLSETEQASDEEPLEQGVTRNQTAAVDPQGNHLPHIVHPTINFTQHTALQQNLPSQSYQNALSWPYFGPIGSSMNETEDATDGILWNWAEVLDIDLTTLDA
ncbi:hypothetical protein NX059_001830 [Plenodomus lindquistii]|nr:hypothetical protein NX059_001830 [Plenodomus lindquistii]